jgi:hypothetical protein
MEKIKVNQKKEEIEIQGWIENDVFKNTNTNLNLLVDSNKHSIFGTEKSVLMRKILKREEIDPNEKAVILLKESKCFIGPFNLIRLYQEFMICTSIQKNDEQLNYFVDKSDCQIFKIYDLFENLINKEDMIFFFSFENKNYRWIYPNPTAEKIRDHEDFIKNV